MTNNQMKHSIIYEKITMQEGDDEQIINYEWPYSKSMLFSEICKLNKLITKFMAAK